MLLGHGTQLSYSSGNDFVKRNVFNCLLKEKREVAAVTLVGRLFHARASVNDGAKSRSGNNQARLRENVERMFNQQMWKLHSLSYINANICIQNGQ